MADETVLGGTAGVPIVADQVGANFIQRVKLDAGGDGVSLPVTAAAPLPVVQTGTPGLPTGAATETTQSAGNTLTGAVTETAPATDTASSGLNGRLQRIAQRLTSIIGLLPASVGQKAMTGSLPVVIASDQSAMPVSGSVTATFTGNLPAGTNNIGDVDVLTMPGTYAEDAGHTTGDVGHLALGVRNDAGTALAGTTLDYIPLTTDSTGALRVTGGGGGTQYAEDAASAGAESMTLAGAVRQDTPASSTSADGDFSNLKVDSVGRLWTNPSGVTQPVSQVGSGTNASGQVTISSTSATVIASRAGRRGILLVNNQSVAVYIDAAGGTATTSKMRLDPGASLFLPVTSAVTGITAAAYSASPADAQIHYTELY